MPWRPIAGADCVNQHPAGGPADVEVVNFAVGEFRQQIAECCAGCITERARISA